MAERPLTCMCGQSPEAWEAKLDKAKAIEREACAKAADGLHDHSECGHGAGYMDGRHDAGAAIRARS